MTPEQRIYAVMFNSIGPALKTAELWAPLFARQRIAESISEALAAQGYAIAPTADPGPSLPAVPDKFSVKVMTPLSPYSPEHLADLLDLDAADLRDRYGDTVLYGLGGEGMPEFRRGGAEPSPAEVRETAAILRQATGSGVAPQPSGTLHDAIPARGGMSGRSDDPNGAASLSEPQPWKGNAVVLVDGQEIPIRADLTIQPASWSVGAHLDPADELYLPLGSCVIRLPDGREGAAVVTSVQNGVCGSLSGVGPPPTSKPLPSAVRDEELETLRQACKVQRDQIRAYVSTYREDTARWSKDLEDARRALFDAAKITGADLDGATSHNGIAGDLAGFALDAVRELRSNYDDEAERAERLTQLRAYALHRRGCSADGVGEPCTCGLAALDSPPFELIELTHEEWETARDNDLTKLGCTLAELEEMARTGDYATPGHRALWLMIKPVPSPVPSKEATS